MFQKQRPESWLWTQWRKWAMQEYHSSTQKHLTAGDTAFSSEPRRLASSLSNLGRTQTPNIPALTSNTLGLGASTTLSLGFWFRTSWEEVHKSFKSPKKTVQTSHLININIWPSPNRLFQVHSPQGLKLGHIMLSTQRCSRHSIYLYSKVSLPLPVCGHYPLDPK